MVIVHIASINNMMTNGISVVVPQHVKAQSKIAQSMLVNIRNIVIPNVEQCEYKGCKNFPDYLPKPFNKPDIVIFHGVNLPEYIKIYKGLVKNGIPYIIVPHGENTVSALKKKWLKKKIAYLLCFNRFIRKSAGLQCLSQGEYNETHTSDRKYIIPNGMELHEQKPVHFDRKGMELVYIGRLDLKIKGLDLLVDAVESISDFMRKNKIILNIFGPDQGDRFAVLRSYIHDCKVEDIINVHGPIFGEDKERALLEYDIFIQTSRSEGLPMGILEALSYGMPVIVTKGTNLMEQIIKFDCGYPAGQDIQTIATAIKTAFNTKELWQIKGKNARHIIEDQYCWEKVAHIAIDTYRHIIANNSIKNN